MRTSSTVACALLLASAAACNEAVGPEGTLRLSVEPTDRLRRAVEQSPAEFSWEMVDREVVIDNATAVAGTVGMHLCGVAIEGDGRLLRAACSQPVRIAGDRLAEGVRSGEAFERVDGVLAPLGSEFFPVAADTADAGPSFRPGGFFSPADASFTPIWNEVGAGVASAREPPESGWSALAVYARPVAGDDGDRVRPFALVMDSAR